MLWQGRGDRGNILFGNVLIRRVESDAAAGTQMLRGVYAEREYQRIEYRDVFYSQLDAAAVGRTILIVEEIGLEKLSEPAHRAFAARLLADLNSADTKFLEALLKRGYRIYLHYMDDARECFVVAKSMRVSPQGAAESP